MSILHDISKIQNPYFRKKIELYCSKLFHDNKLKVIGILVFGSVARNEARNDDNCLSDIDLIVVLEGLNKDYFTRTEQKVEAEGLEGVGVEAIWLTQDELLTQVRNKVSLMLDAFKDGIPIYDPQKLLANTKRELRMELKRRGVRESKTLWIWPTKKLGEKIVF